MKEMHIHIITTGGTIEFHDPAYEDINNILLKLDSSVDSYLGSLIKPHFTYTVEQAFSKDSRDVTESDRQKIVEFINDSQHQNIIVTHGTFTMRESAEYIQERLSDDKKVILTGSMIPLTGFASSDAGFNLGFAVGSFGSLSPGAYISMNGGIFAPSEVTKNLEVFRFE